MGPDRGAEPSGSEPAFWPASWDEALGRLEDYLAAYPRSRALPDLATLLEEADVPEQFVRDDERAQKVLHEAIAARPLGNLARVSQLTTEVELLTLEVEVLADRLERPDISDAEERQVAERLAHARRRLDEIRSVL
ncbi:MAG: hypothetical protein ACRDUY_01260 [Nitriliruptorales bacterium]